MRLFLVPLVALLTLVGCAKNEPVAEAPKSDEPVKEYAIHGDVKRLDAQNKTATIAHEQIGDWMGPMTMEFPVKDPADFAKLREGQTVDAKVFVQGFTYWVSNVQDAPEPAKK